MQWLATADIQRRCQAMGCTSPRREVWFATEFDNEGRAQVTRTIIDNNYLIARAHPPALSKISSILIDDLQAAARGDKTPEDALKDAADKVVAKGRERVGHEAFAARLLDGRGGTVRHQHAQSFRARGNGRRQAGRPATHHYHIGLALQVQIPTTCRIVKEFPASGFYLLSSLSRSPTASNPAAR